MSSPVSLTIPARLTVDPHGQHDLVLHIQVADTGTLPLHITTSTAALSKLAQQYPATSWDVHLRPATFTLQPGQSRQVTLRLTVPRGTKGDHALNAVFRATPVGDPVNGNIAVTGAAASTIVIKEPGHATAVSSTARGVPLMVRPAHAVAPASSGSDVVGGLAFLLLAAILPAWVLIRRHRRRHPKPQLARPYGPYRPDERSST